MCHKQPYKPITCGRPLPDNIVTGVPNTRMICTATLIPEPKLIKCPLVELLSTPFFACWDPDSPDLPPVDAPEEEQEKARSRCMACTVNQRLSLDSNPGYDAHEVGGHHGHRHGTIKKGERLKDAMSKMKRGLSSSSGGGDRETRKASKWKAQKLKEPKESSERWSTATLGEPREGRRSDEEEEGDGDDELELFLDANAGKW